MSSKTEDLVQQGADLRESGNYRESVEILKQAETMPELQHNAYLELSKTYLQMGKLRQAKQTAEKLLRSGTNSIDTFELLGEIYFKDGDVVNAKKYLDKVLDIDSDNIPATIRRLGIATRETDDVKTHGLFEKLFPVMRKNNSFIYDYCAFMISRSPNRNKAQVEKCLEQIQLLKAVGYTNDPVDLFLAIGNLYLGNHEKCIIHLDSFLAELRVQHPEVKRYMIRIYADKESVPFYEQHLSELEKLGDKIVLNPPTSSGRNVLNIQWGPIYRLGDAFELDPTIGKVAII